MVDKVDSNNEGASKRTSGARVSTAEVDAWFAREVLPLEAMLMQFLQQNWRNASDVPDLRQDVYARVYQAACDGLPERPKQYVFATARNLLINRVRQGQVVPIEAASDLEALEIAADAPGPEQTAIARDELRHLQAALDRLPPRARQVILLRRVEGLSRAQIAQRMGITEGTVSQHLEHGIRALVEILGGDPPSVRRS
ncbi:MAG TPA: RNA polymerase sigma factor [Rhizomicrobium sp.]|nr:RNA polymerase sigma factor [Rhizomicrobium sp.]